MATAIATREWNAPGRARLAIAAVLLGMLTLAPVSGGAEVATSPSDHDDALKARARGEIRPLEQILEGLKVHKSDRLVDVEIRRLEGRWIYEVTWLTKIGRLRTFTVDAAQAVVLKDEIK